MDDGHGWEFVKRVTHPALILAPASFLDDICANLWAEGVKARSLREKPPDLRLADAPGPTPRDLGHHRLRLRRQARDRALGRHRSRARGGAVLPEAEELLAFRGLPIRQGGPHLRRAGAPAPMPLAVSPAAKGRPEPSRLQPVPVHPGCLRRRPCNLD